jgi:hypothetical protein
MLLSAKPRGVRLESCVVLGVCTNAAQYNGRVSLPLHWNEQLYLAIYYILSQLR